MTKLEDLPRGRVIRHQFKNIKEKITILISPHKCIYCRERMAVGTKAISFEGNGKSVGKCHLSCYKDDPEWYRDYLSLRESSKHPTRQTSRLKSKEYDLVKRRIMDTEERQELLTVLTSVVLELRNTYLSIQFDLISIEKKNNVRGGYKVTVRMGNHLMEDEFYYSWPKGVLRNRILELVGELGAYANRTK